MWRKQQTAGLNLFSLILLQSDFIEYDDAAEEFHPFVKFFATFDPKVCLLGGLCGVVLYMHANSLISHAISQENF